MQAASDIGLQLPASQKSEGRFNPVLLSNIPTGQGVHTDLDEFASAKLTGTQTLNAVAPATAYIPSIHDLYFEMYWSEYIPEHLLINKSVISV